MRRLAARSLTVRQTRHGRLLELLLVNRGNVTERLGGDRLRLVLVSGGRVFARLRTRGRELLPRSAGIVEFAYRGRVRGAALAHIEVRSAVRGPKRVFHLRL